MYLMAQICLKAVQYNTINICYSNACLVEHNNLVNQATNIWHLPSRYSVILITEKCDYNTSFIKWIEYGNWIICIVPFLSVFEHVIHYKYQIEEKFDTHLKN